MRMLPLLLPLLPSEGLLTLQRCKSQLICWELGLNLEWKAERYLEHFCEERESESKGLLFSGKLQV